MVKRQLWSYKRYNPVSYTHLDVYKRQVVKEGKSFFWSGRYHTDMNSRDTLITDLNVLEQFNPILPDSYQDCQYLMLGNLAPAVQKSVISQLKNRPKLIVLLSLIHI